MKEVYLTINISVKYLEINSLYLIYNSVKVKTILTTKTVKSFYIYLSLINKRKILHVKYFSTLWSSTS